MISIIEFIQNMLGTSNSNYDFVVFIIGGTLILICIDGILSFIFSGISSFTVRK